MQRNCAERSRRESGKMCQSASRITTDYELQSVRKAIEASVWEKKCADEVLDELRLNAEKFSLDKDLTVFRRFNGLRTFYIYYCQRELAELEERLETPLGQDPQKLKVLMQLTGEALSRYSEQSIIQHQTLSTNNSYYQVKHYLLFQSSRSIQFQAMKLCTALSKYLTMGRTTLRMIFGIDGSRGKSLHELRILISRTVGTLQCDCDGSGAGSRTDRKKFQNLPLTSLIWRLFPARKKHWHTGLSIAIPGSERGFRKR